MDSLGIFFPRQRCRGAEVSWVSLRQKRVEEPGVIGGRILFIWEIIYDLVFSFHGWLTSDSGPELKTSYIGDTRKALTVQYPRSDMVQIFSLVSLDARERLDRNDPPLEWLFNGSIPSLVDFLSVPAQPVFPYHLYKTLEYVSPSGPISYLQKRTLHQEGLPGITGQERQKRSNGDTLHRKLSNQDTSPEAAIQCLNLSALPAELIGMIFDELNIIDALCLTVSAQRFWEIGWPYMEKKLMGFMGPWAGHRLVCVGEDPEDYPPDMLNKDEKEELAKGLDADEYDNDEYGKLHAGSPIDLSLLVSSSRYYEAESFVPPFRLVQILDKFAIDQMRNMPRQMRSRVFKFSSFRHCSEFFPDDQKWVLRNLTTHEFVRSEALAGNSSQTGRHMKDLGFEHLILSRTFWSSKSSSAKLKSRSLHRGIWAGHRLEITLLDRHTKSMRSDVAWKDISEDAVEDMIQLMRDADGWLNNKQFKSLDERFNGRLSSQS